MVSERESRLSLVEECKYLISQLPYGEFRDLQMGIIISVLERESTRFNTSVKEILINLEPLDSHVLQSLFTTPELKEFRKSLSMYIQFKNVCNY